MKYLLPLPTLLISMLLYIALASTGPLDRIVSDFAAPSGAITAITAGEMIILLSIPLFVVEMWKSTSIGNVGMVDHMLSLLVAVVAGFAYLTAPAFGTSTFLILVAMQFADVAAGVIVSIRAARRDFGIEA